MKNKFLIFCGQEYYANGGANDIMSIMNDKDKAIEHAKSLIGKRFITNYHNEDEYGPDNPVEWVQVFDIDLCEVIYREGGVHGDDSGIILI